MNEQPDHLPPGDDFLTGDHHELGDDRIRRQLTHLSEVECPNGIESQVLSKVVRRRRVMRAVRDGLAVMALVAVGLLSRRSLITDSQTTIVAQNERAAVEAPGGFGVPGVETVLFASLSAPSPVVPFDVLDQDLGAMVQFLKTYQKEGL